MKKINEKVLMLGLIMGLSFMLVPRALEAQAGDPPPDGESCVCCQSKSLGCYSRTGMWFPTDYVYFGEFCP